jgi:uncharacterized OsmC-like protein
MDMGKGLKVTNTARDLEFVLDEPTSLGGTDLGMNPVEGLLSALGACKAIVVKSFARLHKIKLQDVRIECEGDLDPDGFLGKNPDAKIGFSRIKTHYYIKADNTPEEIAEFVKFVESNCPVNDTIVNTPKMEDEIHN